MPTKPGSATLPLPGIVAGGARTATASRSARTRAAISSITQPWPGMLRTIWGDPERYKKQYWSQMPGIYFTGDGARRDEDGYFWVMGRIDDVLNVAGHRLGTMEIESALVSHPAVAEAAVVGRPDDLKGQAIAAFVTLEAGQRRDRRACKKALKEHVAKEIGAFARPDDIRFTDALPKTRSGKIMRRLLRDIAAGKETRRRHDDARGLLGAGEAARGRGVARGGPGPHEHALRAQGAAGAAHRRAASASTGAASPSTRARTSAMRAPSSPPTCCAAISGPAAWRVTFVRNFTDIDDKIIRRAAQEGITPAALAEREIAAFAEDVAWLAVPAARRTSRAPPTHIDDMIALDRAPRRERASRTRSCDGSVYFRVRRFAEYGKLSHQRLEDMAAGEEIDPDKEDVARLRALERRQARRADVAEPLGARTSRLAHRVLRDGGSATWASRSTSTAAAPT